MEVLAEASFLILTVSGIMTIQALVKDGSASFFPWHWTQETFRIFRSFSLR